MSQPDLIKLRVPGETFWATKLTEDTAKVDNILLNSGISLNDVVKFNPQNNEIISVLVKKTNTIPLTYDVGNAESNVLEIYKKVFNYFEEKGIQVEGVVKGVVLLAVPIEISEEVVNKFIKECPIKTKIMQ